jgi:hypothetical protein
MALYLAFLGVLAVRGVFIHASVKNGFVDLLRGVALLLRVVSMRGAAFAALLLCCCSGLPGDLLRRLLLRVLLQFLQGRRFLRCCCFCSGCLLGGVSFAGGLLLLLTC